jgi:hypothetical protein
MINLNFDGKKANRGHEKQIRDIVDTHLVFPGSDKLKLGVNIKENGAFSLSFTGPQDAIAEAERLWKENVTPAAKKLQKAAAKIKRSTAAKTAAVKKTNKTAVKKVAAKATPGKKTAKKTVVRTKAKVAAKPAKKRKS